MEKPVKELIEEFAAALLDHNAAVFAGAGLSVPAGFVNWRELMRGVAQDLSLNVDQEHDLISLAQYHTNERRSRHRLTQVLIDELTKDAKVTENHRILARLPIQTFWTTNYDPLIEKALAEVGKIADVKIMPDNLATTKPRRDAVVYKMHGDHTMPQEAVITKDDYEAYNSKRQLFSTSLQGDLVDKTFLFIGFSFNDPNLSYILSRIRVLLGQNRRDHYCLMRRVQRKDFKKTSAYDYAKTKQALQISDLKRYGIIGVLVDDYQDYTAVLQAIERRYRGFRVFISGSAATFDPWQENAALEFIEKLSTEIIHENFRIVSGFGQTVGSAVINGAILELDRHGSRALDDRLLLRPFPQYATKHEDLKKRWRQYREDIVPRAGMVLFLFGNKLDQEGNVVEADGMIEEFEIATTKGLTVIPVGSTGYISRTLFDKVNHDFDRYFGLNSGLKTKFQNLGKKNAESDDLIKNIIALLKAVRDERYWYRAARGA